MTPIDDKPSRNEDEYFARENAEAIKAMRAQLDAAREKAERESHLMRCPRCGGALRERKQGSVVIDVCDDCGGTWLDKGELELLAQSSDQSEVRRYLRTLFGAKE